MLKELLNQGTPIEVTPIIDAQEFDNQTRVKELFENAVEDIKVTLQAKCKPIAHVGLSHGKDSKLVVLVAIRAYAQLIAEGRMEASRPLVVTTVDTLTEAIPMVMLTKYNAPRLVDYARSLNVNLQLDIVTPRLTDEYFIRWASAQKLISNPSRSGDCSVILKVDVAERHLRSIQAGLVEQGYTNSPLITLLGSRDAESARRKKNITKAELRDNPLLGTQKVSLGKKHFIYQYAPVCDWEDEDVFLFHSMAGSNPITKSLLGNTEPLFPSFLEHHGLMLAIYGNGRNEACQVVVGQKNTASCGGKSARFGCYICTMVGNKDRSSEALAELPRWATLGGENALAVRDYLFRLSTNMGARAFHPKAVDGVAYNRVALQPNVLKAKYLEKLVWFASALAVDSRNEAKRFRKLVAQGRAMEHEGMMDIASDPTLSPKVKEQFLDMYKEVAQQELYTCFSERHAVMLSFRWLVDGVASTSFKPISIFQRVLNGERLPWPMKNKDYEASYGKISMQTKLPEAMMMRIFKKSYEEKFNPIHSPSFLSYWQRPVGALDIYDNEYNCAVETQPSSQMAISVKSKCHYHDDGKLEISYKNVQIDGRNATKQAELIAKDWILKHLEAHYRSASEAMVFDSFNDIKALLAKEQTVSLAIPYIKALEIGHQLNNGQAKTKPYHESTKRAFFRKNGRIHRTTTKLNFYPPRQLPADMKNSIAPIKSLVTDFATDSNCVLSMTEENDGLIDNDKVAENLTINDNTLRQWLSIDGWDKAIEQHDRELKARIEFAKRAKGRPYIERQIRVFGGTSHAYDLLRQAGIEVAPQYKKQLIRSIKRTDIFAEIGIYDYAALPQRKLLELNNIIDMKQHRRDKVACVNMIRKERNAARRMKRQLLSLEFGDVLNTHLSQYSNSINAIQQGLTALLRGHVDTAEPSSAQRMATARMHLALSTDTFESNQSCYRRLFNTYTFEKLQNQPKKFVHLNAIYKTNLSKVAHHIESVINEWETKLKALKELRQELMNNREKDHNAAWLTFQSKHNSEVEVLPTYYPAWHARRETKIDKIQEMTTTIEKVLGELEVVKEMMIKSTASVSSNTMKALSTASTLKLLKLVA